MELHHLVELVEVTTATTAMAAMVADTGKGTLKWNHLSK